MPSISSWGLKLEPGKPHKVTSFPEELDGLVLRITNVALGENIADPNGRSVVKLTKTKSFLELDEGAEEPETPESEVFVLAALTPGKIEQALINIEFGDELVQLEVVGKNEVHLLGNWVDQSLPDEPPYGSDADGDEEGAYRLQDVSSDVEIDPEDVELDEDDDDADRFEKVVEPKGTKRSADAMDEDAPVNGDLSKKQKKKLAKKLKNEAGDAVPPATSVASTAASPDSKKSKEVKGSEKPKSEKKDDKKDKKIETTVTVGQPRTLPSGLVILDAKVGTGKAAKSGNTVSMRYIGKLEDGKVFDKNTKGTPFTFHLGAGEVIKGWDQGISGMQVGGERVLTVPSTLGYGKRGSKPEIPPNATLTFEVKLLEIK